MTFDKTFENAARELVVLVKSHRVAGDGDLEAALARVEGLLAVYEAQRQSDQA